VNKQTIDRQGIDRRRHKRHRVACAAAIQRSTVAEPVKSKTIDVSDGGAMLAIPVKVVPRLSERVRVVLALPRSTPNTYMVEEISMDALVIRHQPMEADDVVGVALQFQVPKDLGLEV
jgi:c-di-GMP-binding flagellar brake protein YcgR